MTRLVYVVVDDHLCGFFFRFHNARLLVFWFRNRDHRRTSNHRRRVRFADFSRCCGCDLEVEDTDWLLGCRTLPGKRSLEVRSSFFP